MHSGPSHFKHLLHINIEYSVGSRVGRKGYTLIQKNFELKTSTFYIANQPGVRIYLPLSLDPDRRGAGAHAHRTLVLRKLQTNSGMSRHRLLLSRGGAQ